MARIYKKNEVLENTRTHNDVAVQQTPKKVIIEKDWSLRRASWGHAVAYGTLNNKYRGRNIRGNGGRVVFTNNEEKYFLSTATICGEWRFLLDAIDWDLL